MFNSQQGGGIAILGWASIISLKRVDPDLGAETINTGLVNSTIVNLNSALAQIFGLSLLVKLGKRHPFS